MVFKLPLAPPETLGRRFQYAFLSLDPLLSKLDPLAGYAIFDKTDDYLELVNKALSAINAIRKPRVRRSGKCVNVQGIDCCSLHEGPTLYATGKEVSIGGRTFKGDYRILALAGLNKCPYITAGNKVSFAWIHAAVSYADMVISNGSPLGGRVDDLPWLAKATLFGKMRVTGGGGKQPITLTLDSLGSILLGGSIAFLLKRRINDSTLEFYLVPDSVHSGFANLRNYMLLHGNIDEGTMAKAVRMASDYPISLEVAISLILAGDLASKYGRASQMSYTNIEELEMAATIVTVARQKNRPMIVSVIPLSMIIYLSYKPHTILSTIDLATRTKGAKELQGFRSLIADCINSMYLQAVHKSSSDHLSGCIRGLMTAADQADDKGLTNLRDRLRSLVSMLARDYLAITRGQHP